MAEQRLLKKKHKAEAESNQALVISVSIDLAEFYFREGRYDDAIVEYKKVSAFYKEQKRCMDYARVNRMIGEAYNFLREFDTALKHQEVHLAVAKEQGDKVEEQRALAAIGQTYITTYLDLADNSNKKSLELAYRAFKRSLAVCESGLKGISKREHMDMTARILANLGVVEECLGNYDKGITLVQRSINICKSNDIYEQLERGYNSLGSLYAKKGDYSDAIHYYNLAIEVAGRLDDKISPMSSSLTAKADILIKLADFHRAKNVLLRAYKLKNRIISEHESIEQNLKVVTAMCYTEDSLLLASDTDFKTKKSLYEQMGDGACFLKNYTKAIEYYLKMLECARKNGDSGKVLSGCYISLAQTYNDNHQFDLAIEYFKKEYEICRGNIKESISTLSSMIDSMELGKKSLDEIAQVFNMALKECRDAGNKYLEGKILTRYITTIKKLDSSFDTRSLENDLNLLDYNPSESESETDELTTQNIGDDIDLDAITDDSEASGDETNERKPRTARRRTKKFVLKRNNKGETQLHTACIAGNAPLVEKLLDQGHDINIRDHCGWLPIHEACICGHLPIVQMLVDKGATINDRGGSLCLGMTPLHDAASNGHLEIIDYLLDKGASAVAKTDHGTTPLDIIISWRSNEQLDPVTQSHYENIVKRMTAALEKTVQNNKENINTRPKENTALILQETSPESEITTSQKRSTRASKSKPQIGDLRRNIENDFDEINDDFGTNATCEYKNIMENIRHRSSGSEDVKKRSLSGNVKMPALLEPNDVDDDWLDDDLGIAEKKRRKTSGDIYINSSGMNNEEVAGDHLNRKRRKKQSTLIKAGFTRIHSESPTGSQKSSPVNLHKQQKKMTSYTSVIEPDSTSDISVSSSVSSSTGIMNKTLSIDVRIDGKLFRIPIPVSELDTLTMKWLADEATRRFYKKESMRPTIELETKNGALLSEDDFVSILFPVGGLQSEEVQAKVVKWNIPPISERYRDACSTLNYGVSERVVELLETTSVTLSLPDENLRKQLYPVCRAINRQSNLYELNLGGNFIGDRCIEFLCESLPTLDNLAILILSSNNLTYKSLNTISTTLTQSSKPLLANLFKLDLSFNPLNNESFKFLAALTKSLKLKSLSLCSVDFNSEIFQLFYNKNLELQLEFIEDFDVSYNTLSKDNLSKFISWLQPLNIRSLNVGNNSVQSDGLGKEIAVFFRRNEFGFPNLKNLNFSKCRINDEEVLDFVSVLKFAEHLEELDLSCNAITSSSLKLILENLSLSRLNVSCCGISADLDWNPWKFVDANKKCRTLCTTLDYVDNYRECDALVNLWKLEYKERADVKGLDSGMLHLSVSDFFA